MSGIVFDIKRFAIHDGPGIRTSIFFKGCPLSCWWCHNPESRKFGIEKLDTKFKGSYYIGWETTAQELLKEVEKDRLFYEQSQGGVTFTGGEPLLQHQFLKETAQLFKQKKLHLCLDTTGYAAPAIFRELSPLFDLFLFDLKHLDQEAHKKYSGVSNQQILQNLEYLTQQGKEVHIRFPYIPGINNQPEHLKQLAEYLSKLNNIRVIHILPYHKIAQGKYQQLAIENKMKETEEPSNEEIKKAKAFFETYHFDVRIGG